MKRIICGALATLLFLGCAVVNAAPVWADPADEIATQNTQETLVPMTTNTEGTTTQYQDLSISDDCMDILKLEEGFSRKPYWDYSQWTVGYGTKCPDDKLEEYKANGISEEAAEILLRNHLVGIYSTLNSYAKKYSINFTQNQFDALILMSYNCGTGWTYDTNGTLNKAIRNGATGNELIRAFALWCNAGGSVQDYLLRRRLSESYMYLEGKYAQYPPDNYCYVIYDGNGGTTSPRSQGYDSNLTATPFPVPTYSGHTFMGWYTAKTGGTKVTVLDASTKSKTLYARWDDAQDSGDESKPDTETISVNVTVTASGVNVRKGPGTNYTTIGTKNRGDKLVITQTATGGSYRWGKFDGGWICLDYTDYDTVIQGGNNNDSGNNSTTTPTTTPTTQPTTKPTTKPTTQPTTTAPSTTAPTTPANTVKGTVNVSSYLCVRSGPGTSYPAVGQLKTNTRVEILEQKAVGGMTWGRISDGWISLSYVKLDSTNNNTNENGTTGGTNTSTQSWTGVVANCSDALCIRSGAGTTYSVVGYLYPGDKVTITSQTQVGSLKWGKISRGWICMSYVKLDSGNTSTDSSNNNSSNNNNNNNNNNTESGNTTTTNKTGTVTANSLRIRSAAGTSSTTVGYLNTGARVTITQTTSVNGVTWGKIDRGWICLDYVKLDSSNNTTTNQQSTKTVTANCLCVRQSAGTTAKIVGYLYHGAKVSVTETTTVNGVSWGRVSNGWICMDYVK